MQNAISHPVKRSHLDDASGFSFVGCGTDPHQSPIRIKAGADILAIAPGTGRAPEKRRYQADVQGLHQQYGYPGCGRLVSAHGLGVSVMRPLYQDGGDRRPINSLVAGQPGLQACRPRPNSDETPPHFKRRAVTHHVIGRARQFVRQGLHRHDR
jgi:hypothetical protein